MIKPQTLWGLFKTCQDSKWLGDVCRALGRQDIELDFGQKQIKSLIEQDSGWYDENIAVNREEEKKRKAAYREKKKKEAVQNQGVQKENVPDVPDCPGDNAGQVDVPDCPGDNGVSRDVPHPYIHTNIHTDILTNVHTQDISKENKCVNKKPIACAHTRGDESGLTPPSIDDVRRVAEDAVHRSPPEVIPEDFYTEWLQRMNLAGWKDANGKDILQFGWKQKFAYAWRDEKRARRDAEKKRKADEQAAAEAEERAWKINQNALRETEFD